MNSIMTTKTSASVEDIDLPPGVALDPLPDPSLARVLSPEAIAFLADLERTFGPTRQHLLDLRQERQQRLDQGERPDFLPETAPIRNGDWKVAPLPADLADRRVEITGPVDRKMVINALNSGASCYMADFEDSTSPTWRNVLEGQANLIDAVRRSIAFEDERTGKLYRLVERPAVLMTRPRGWHLPERHFRIDGKTVSASLFDFGLYVFHNAHELLKRGSGPYFYLPKIESHLEARLWNQVFDWSERRLNLREGAIKATVLIETILAAFEMDEILYELKERSAGLNCGRWDYIFSFIKKFRVDPAMLTPDRVGIGMTSHFLRSYSLLVIKTCHRRGVHAIGGMAAQIPIKNDAQANEIALAKVRADKEREAGDGHDGTWVAHPALAPIARAIFDRHLAGANQIARQRQDVQITASDLLRVPEGKITLAGLALNVSIGIAYLEAWLSGIGCVPLNNLMEDAATAEISRAQTWQWLRHGAKLEDGRRIDLGLVEGAIATHLESEKRRLGDHGYLATRNAEAAQLFKDMATAQTFADFLTLPAYDRLKD
jgi:malate synthase